MQPLFPHQDVLGAAAAARDKTDMLAPQYSVQNK